MKPVPQIRKIQPAEGLRKYVRYFWTFEGGNFESDIQTFKILPDGLTGIIFHHYNGNAVFEAPNGHKLPTSFIYGQATTSFTNFARSDFSAIGACMYPWALTTLFKTDAHELSNTLAVLNDFSDFNINNQLLNSFDQQSRIQILCDFLLKKIKTACENDKLIEYCINEINNIDSGVTLERLHKRHKISERQFERRFKKETGIGPYQFMRISRFQQSIKMLHLISTENLSAVAYELGYADQSHFIREFRQYSGLNPKEYLKQEQKNLKAFKKHPLMENLEFTSQRIVRCQ